MKKSLLILFALLPTFLYAGVIVKQSGERLEDVTIKSVTNSEIIYVINGTESTLSKSEVSAILYDDGRYEELNTSTFVSTDKPVVFKDYDTEAMRTYTQDQKKREAEAKKLALEQKMREAKAKKLALEQKKREVAEKRQAQEAAKLEALEKARIEAEEARLAQERTYQDGLIHKISANQYYFVDNYYSKKDIQSLVLTQCPDAKQYYDKAKKWMVWGWSGAGVGLAMVIVGSVLTGIGIEKEEPNRYWVDAYSYINEWGYETTVSGHYEYAYNSNAFPTLTLPGIIFLTVGAAGTVSSIVIASIGHHRMNNAYKVYNESCAVRNKPALSLNFGISRNGIGLALHF